MEQAKSQLSQKEHGRLAAQKAAEDARQAWVEAQGRASAKSGGLEAVRGRIQEIRTHFLNSVTKRAIARLSECRQN